MICRVEKTKGFTVMSNYHLRDERLSLKAKGLLSVVLSLPEKWDYSIKGLETICKEGKAAVASALKELEEFKYLEREQAFCKNGFFDGFTYVFYEFPQPYTENRVTVNPYTENPYTENRYTENQPQLNTNIITTEILNIDQIINEEYTTAARICEDDRFVLKNQKIYLYGKFKTIMLISDCQIESLNKDLTARELEHYIDKFEYLSTEGYQHSCSDYEYIMRMVEADRSVRKKGVS